MRSYMGFRLWTFLMWPVTLWMSNERKIKFFLNYLFANPYNAASAYYMAVVESGNFTSRFFKEGKNAFGMTYDKTQKIQKGSMQSTSIPNLYFAKYRSYAATCWDFYRWCNDRKVIMTSMGQAPTLTPVTGKPGIIQYNAFDNYYRNNLSHAFKQENYYGGASASAYSAAVLSSARVDLDDGNIDQYGWDRLFRMTAPGCWLILIILICFAIFKIRKWLKKPKSK